MGKGKNIILSIVLLATLLLSSGLAISSEALSTSTAVENETNYGDVMQYEWPGFGYSGAWQLYSPGPAPNRPDILWSQAVTGLSQGAAVPGLSATVTAFNGKVFVAVAGSQNKVYAFDAFTGAPVWTTSIYMPQSAPQKIDNTYCFVDCDSGAGGLAYSPVNAQLNGSVAILRISDGVMVANLTIPNIAYTPGAGGYFPGVYDPQLHMKYVRGYNYKTSEVAYYGINLTDPLHPSIGWKTVSNESGEELCAGGGINWVGTVNGAILAFNGSTGDLMYRARKVGFAQYSATYVDGMLIHGSSSTTLTCYNASTGEILWDADQGGRAFFSFAGAAAYGRYFETNVAIPDGYIGCWDLKTGDLLWKNTALFNFGYNMPVVADGKVYTQRYSGTAGGVKAQPDTFSCFDAFTGALVWELPNTLSMNPSVAYGNLYAIVGNVIRCYSDRAEPAWSMWRGNADNPGVIKTQAPLDITAYDWKFDTPDALSGSPAIANGKVYFGSHDQNIYCVDAYTGSLVWNFTTKMMVYSSPAVANGLVYTGSDDGNVYALNADSGEVKWTAHLTDTTTFIAASTWQPRSSPIIVGNHVYIGALDGYLYALDTITGQVQWRGPAGANSSCPIAGSAAYSNGVVYFSSTDHNLYALNSETGALVWKATANATIGRAYTGLFPWSTPAVFNNTVYWGAGPVYGRLDFYAINATDGKSIWNVTSQSPTPTDRRWTGNTPICQSPVVIQWNSTLSVMVMPEFMGVTIRNAVNGVIIFHQFVGHEVYSSIAYANDTNTPKIYLGSDTYSVTCLNMTAAMLNRTDSVLSLYNTKSEVQSSPSVWAGKLFVTSTDGSLYMFSDNPNIQTSIYANADKGAEIWSNETITINGKVQPEVTVTNNGFMDFGTFATNGLYNATIKVSITKPDGTSENLTTTTDYLGRFNLSYSPTEPGNWGWVAYYEGVLTPLISYSSAYSQWTPFTVSMAPVEPTPTPVMTPSSTLAPTATATTTPTVEPTPTPTATPTSIFGGMPTEFVLAAVAVVVIIAAIGAYVFTKRRKKK